MQRLQRAPGHSGHGSQLRSAASSRGRVGLELEVVAAAAWPSGVQFPRPPRQGFGAEPGGAAQVGSEGAQVLWVWWPRAAAMTAPVTMLELVHGVSQQLRKS